jgi:hypothetical protein
LEVTTDNEAILEFQTTFNGSRLLEIRHDYSMRKQINDSSSSKTLSNFKYFKINLGGNLYDFEP